MLSRCAIDPLSKAPGVFEVAVWAAESSFTKVTFDPTFTCRSTPIQPRSASVAHGSLACMRRSLTVAVLLVLAGAAASNAEARSFRAELFKEGVVQRATAECTTSGPGAGRLTCLLYGAKLPKEAGCTFGGAIPTMTMTRGGRARRGFVCIDEAFHGQPKLRGGRRFRSGPFVCRHLSVRRDGEREGLLRCRRGAGPGFSFDARGAVKRLG